MNAARNEHRPFADTASRKRPFGFTLVELMVALTIGLLLLAGVSAIFATSRSTYTMEEGLGRIQESGRFAMEYLGQDIRTAGYLGCNSTASAIVNNMATTNTDPYRLVPGTGGVMTGAPTNPLPPGGIKAFIYSGSTGNARSDWTPNLPSEFFAASGEVQAGTDVLLVQRATASDTVTASTTSNNLTADMVAATDSITITANSAGAIAVSDILVISDCLNADIFTASSVATAGSVTTIGHAAFNKVYKRSTQGSAQVMKFTSRVYYVRPAASSADEPALMRREISNGAAATPPAAQEIAQGIEDMRLGFGVDMGSNTVEYGDAGMVNSGNGTVTYWNKITTVRIGLLLRTPTKVEQGASNDSGKFSGGLELVDGVLLSSVPDDNRQRQVYKSTISVRGVRGS